MQRRVCVVGAGVAGLSSARHLLAAGQLVTVLETTAYVGGTWRYDARVGQDEYGKPIHTSMYEHLRTNLPKQTMELPGFPTPTDMPTFPTGKQYYKYLQSFAEHFNLKKHIKFLHEVTLVTRLGQHWRVAYRSLVTGDQFEEVYDYVFICSGHYSTPILPNIRGEEKFNGSIIHSHDYRRPDPYVGRRVLVVGAGPSAVDIGLYLADFSAKLLHSHHSPVKFRTPFPDNYVQRPDVEEFTESGVRFKDGTYEDVDDVIYCTGFEYSYPFLDDTSGLTLHRTAVTPLYRHVVNIQQPTMLLLGLVVRACIVVTIDAQARYGAALVAGRFSLPPQDAMLAEWGARVDGLSAQGRRLSDVHVLAADEDQYYANLTSESGIELVPPALASIKTSTLRDVLANYYTYRDYHYTLINATHFTKEYKPTEERL